MKKAVVIGASSGIGKELAIQLTNQNYQVTITGRRKELLNQIVATNSHLLNAVEMNVCNVDETHEKFEHILHQNRTIDLLVFCAAIGSNDELDTLNDIQLIETNVKGFITTINWFYRLFEEQKFGHIAVITSIAGLRGSRIASTYFAAKAFQINYLEGLKQRSSKLKNNVFITDIRPGFVDTDMLSMKNLPWTSSATKAAKQIIQAIKRKKATIYVTKRWVIVGFLMKIFPAFLYKKL